MFLSRSAKQAPTVAILGAGCAGTLVADELRRRRFAGHLEIFDARTNFSREQRWCFWRKRGEAAPDLPISAEWSAWQVADRRRAVRRSSPSHVYSHVYAPEFFRRFHDRLAGDSQVALRLGCRVSTVTKRGDDAYRVHTGEGEFLADLVIDARHEGTPAYQRATIGTPGMLWQSFHGRVLEFADARFAPDTATLMDFRTPAASGGLTFAYVLPFTRTRALVEAVVLGSTRASAPALDAILDAYLQDRGGGGEILAVEDGTLPMTVRRFTSSTDDATMMLGVGGGAARPSSGYAFASLARAACRTAAAVCAGRPLRQPRFAWKYRVLDSLFLRLLRSEPDAAQRAFMAMFAGVAPDQLVRFLSEASTPRDDLALGFALPKTPFLRTFLPIAISRETTGNCPSLREKPRPCI